MVSLVGGQSRPGGRRVLVTPRGREVGSAGIPGIDFPSGRSRSRGGNQLDLPEEENVVNDELEIQSQQPPSNARSDSRETQKSVEVRESRTDSFTGLTRRPGESNAAFESRKQSVIRAAEQSTQQSLQRPNITLQDGSVGIAQAPRLQERILSSTSTGLSENVSFAQNLENTITDVGARTTSPSIIGIGSFGFRPRETVDFNREFSRAIIPSNREELVSFGLSAGLGAGFGAGTRALGAGISGLGGKFGTRGALAAQKLGGAVNVGAGAGLGGVFLTNVAAELPSIQNASQAGSFAGGTARDLLAFGGGAKAGSKAVDVSIGLARTAGLQRLPREQIVAQESLAGQKFPSQQTTAGNLRKQFFETVPALGESRGVARGFRASDLPTGTTLSGGRIRRKELTGTFIAPRLNPTFFRQRASSLSNPFRERPKDFLNRIFTGQGLPRATRFTLDTLEFAPGVTASTPLGTPLRVNPARFSESIRGTSRTVIPAQKTELEAVIALDAPATRPRKVGFINEGLVRVPVFESRVLPQGGARTVPARSIPLDVSVSARGSSRGFSTSSSVLGGFRPLSASPSSSGGRSSTFSSFFSPISPVSSGSSGSGMSGFSGVSSSFQSSSSSSSSVRRGSGFGGGSSGLVSGFNSGSSRRNPFGLPGFGAPKGSRRVRGKRKFKRRPSLGAVILDIQAPAPVRGEQTGLVLRPLIRSRRRRRRR